MLGVFLSLGLVAHAVELRPIEVVRGTNGLVEAPLTVTNSSARALTCHADLAHWYSTNLTVLAPGAAKRIALWFDPRSSAFVLLNDKQENMPVEALWCGVEGRAYLTRARLALDRSAPPNPSKAPRAITCSSSGDGQVSRVICE